MSTPVPALSRGATAAIALICVANFFNYLDRQVVSAVEHDLRPALGMSKAEFGYLWSAFTLGYMVCAPLVGFVADRRARPQIFAVCVLVWSVATMASGYVSTKEALYLARGFIGVGEAGCLVIGPSLVVDLVPREKRGRAIALFYLGMPLGGPAGYVLGGVVSQSSGGYPLAFVLAGAPGILVAALLWLLRDPPRGGSDATHETTQRRSYLRLASDPGLLFIVLAQAAAVSMLAPVLHFAVGFFEETREMTRVEATTTLGAIALGAGVLGNALSGFLGDRIARSRQGGYALLAACGYAISAPCMMLGFTNASPAVFIPALALGSASLFLCMPAVNTEIANLVPADQRAMAYAFAVFVAHLLGDMSVPPLFGALADRIGAEAAFFRFSFALILASGLCLAAARTFARRSLATSHGSV